MEKVLKVRGLWLMALMVACSSPSTGPAAGPTPNIDATVQVAVQGTVQARDKTTPTSAPALLPTLTLSTPAPTMEPQAQATSEPAGAGTPTEASKLIVTGVGVEGVSLRNAPGVGDRLTLLEDGAEVTVLGDEQEADGRLWKHVKDGDDTEGWIAAEFVAEVIALATQDLAVPVASDLTPVPISTAEAQVVPPYEWINSALTSQPSSRTRYSTEVVMPPTYTDDQTAAVLADAVRRTFREQSDAQAVVVFGYSSSEQVGKRPDKGRALASRDGLGWTGDKTFLTFLPRPAPDDGRIYVTLGLTGSGPQSERVVDR